MELAAGCESFNCADFLSRGCRGQHLAGEVARPSIRTVHAPHWPSPQLYLVPVRLSLFLKTESKDSPSGGFNPMLSAVHEKAEGHDADNTGPIQL